MNLMRAHWNSSNKRSNKKKERRRVKILEGTDEKPSRGLVNIYRGSKRRRQREKGTEGLCKVIMAENFRNTYSDPGSLGNHKTERTQRNSC